MIDPSERVAIVGIGGVFPGAPDPERFWANIAAGIDSTTEVPVDRWALDPAVAFDPTVATPDRVYATRGGFVGPVSVDLTGLDIDSFIDLTRLDPAFHLALYAGSRAWRDAKTVEVDRARVGVVFGNIVLPTVSTSALAEDTLGRAFERQVLGAEPSARTPTDPLNRHAAGLPAGLLARALGLGGGAYTLDAACASTLYALKLAADEVLSGRADAMLTGGLSRPDPLYTQMGFSQLRALSPDGRAYPFDARGGGLVVGEGAGMFVVKRLSDALRHGDTIYGLVAAVGLSNDVDGGLLAPSGEGQLRALRAAYEQAGWEPSDVDLIECHATGTPVGDAVEFQSLKTLWSAAARRSGGCVIGSHKANIGHLLTASGASGLLKILMALKHQTLPPTANFETPSAKLDYENGPFRVLTRAERWEPRAPGRPRRAAISGFGFGGINAHALIEEWLPEIERAGMSPRGAIDPEREADPAPVAIVGLGAHVGPWRGLRAFQERALGGSSAEPAASANDWGIGTGQLGFFVDSLTLRLDRFRIPPKELEAMLPQQSLMLLAAADAVADAGWDDQPRLRAGVFVGIGLDPNTSNFHVRWTIARKAVGWNETLKLGLEGEALERWIAELRAAAGPPLTANRTMGALGGIVASRIAREFRVGGPSFTVSSEETSGLRALDVAVRLLRQGEIDEAIVGAVDLTGDPRLPEIDNLVRGDGAVALVLKRLDDAERDGDRIHGLIRGIGAASAVDLSLRSQKIPPEAARRAELESSDVREPGLTVGATTERFTLPDEPFGHTGAAAGLVALVRATVSLYQQVLPIESSAIGPRFWLQDRAEGPRQASVSALGMDGTSHHVILEAPTGIESQAATVERQQPLGALPTGLFAIEADDVSRLLREVDALATLAEAHADFPIEALARQWWSLRPNNPAHRLGLAVVAESAEALRDRLASARRRLEGGAPDRSNDAGLYFADQPLGPNGQVAFVYPGIGNHFPGMGRDLSARWPEVYRSLDAETARLRSQLAPGAAWNDAELPEFEDHRAPILGQVVLGTAISDLLRRFGVRPEAVIGYSLGESSALFATRAWTERDLMHARLDASPLFRNELNGPCDAARRAWRLTPGEPVDWLAGIIPASPAAVRAALVDIPRAYLLIINTPNECVVGGRRRAVERLAAALGGRFLPLPVVSTVHCEIAREVEDAYRALHTLTTTPPAGIRVYSAGWGRAYLPDRATAAEAIVAQALDTVDYPAVIERAYEDGVRVFVEVGPGASCSRLIRLILGNRPHVACAVCVPGENAVDALLSILGRLIAERIPVDLTALYGLESHASALAPEDATPPTRLLTVAVGGRPFNPRIPTPIRPQPHVLPRPEVRPTVSPRTTIHEPLLEPEPFVTATAFTATLEFTAHDPLTHALVNAESERGKAHEAFLRQADGLSQTMANHIAFQMALVEALQTAPAAPLDISRRMPARETVRAVTLPEEPPRALDRAQCLEFAVGAIGKVLGAKFAAIDAHPTRVRLPAEPLMLVDRITAIEGEPLSMTSGKVVTEHDVFSDDWYLDGGKVPACIAVESGQADLFLSGFLGIDFETKGEAVYRLLDAVIVFHRGLPVAGEVIRYDIAISGFFRQGDTILFRFHFDATINGAPLLTMRDGCAGFFTAEALAAGQGVIRRPLDQKPIAGKKPDDWSSLAPMAVESYTAAQVDALRHGDLVRAFGAAFAGLHLAESARLPGGRMTLLHRVSHLDPTGGRFGLGLIRGELDIAPDDWFITCHFIDDQVMPGTLMYECCLHTLRIFLTRLGWVPESEGAAYEPVPGVASRLRCRGQVLGSTRLAVFEITVKELGYRPEPFAIADALMFADGKPIVEVADMTLRLTGLDRATVERTWRDRSSPQTHTLVNTREQILAFARGNPSEAFGAPFRPFDADRFLARLPSPPYSFLDRVVATDAAPYVLSAGGTVEAEYDVPADAWYFAADRQARMPFAVLLEIPLQVCGWMSAYLGSALTSSEDLCYRNLGGTASAFENVTPATGTLSNRIKMTKVSNSGGMIIQHFDFETRAGSRLVYKGDTYFGFFRREALANQVGIRDAAPYRLTDAERARARSFDYPRTPPFPDDMLRMIDRVDAYVSDGGPHGLGVIEGSIDVDPSSWYFDAHFYQDPVVPGSLGLESFLQLLKVMSFDRWGATTGGFEPIGLGDTHRWVYRGQILPTDRRVTTRAVVTALDDAQRWLKADGFLEVDGRIIYQMNDFTLRLS